MQTSDRADDQLEHLVQLYDTDEFLVESLQQFVAAGLAAGEACLVIATPEHRADLASALDGAGSDVAKLTASGQYVAVDAQQLLDTFLCNGAPDAMLFHATLGGMIDQAATGGRMVRAYGEMVALLWAVGNVAAALELEGLWNALGSSRRFSLLCGYPVASFTDPSSANAFRAVCAGHSRVLPATAQGSLSLPAELTSGGQARAYLRGVLPGMACVHVLDDAALLLSEVVNNAVVHANSGVEVQLRRTQETLHVEVTDRGAGGALRRDAGVHEMGGRGLAMLETVARSWNSAADGAMGHRVWFELDLTV